MKSWNMGMSMQMGTTTRKTNIPLFGGMLVFKGCVVNVSFLTLVLSKRPQSPDPPLDPVKELCA